jgi:23S rRNA (uracil1939-C5)-methyltransferase
MAEEELVELTVADIAPFGDGLGRYNARVVFIPQGIPQERVLVQIRRGRRRFLIGEIKQIYEPSPYRQPPVCPYFGQCSGCQWQHMEYGFQLKLKRQRVVEQLCQTGGFSDPPVNPVLPVDSPWHYRNHARFSVQRGELGFVHRERRKFIRVSSCYLMHPWINFALEQLQGKAEETSQVAVRYGVNTGEWLIQPALHSPDISLGSGQPFYHEELLGWRFRISAASFFQVNTAQAEKLVQVVRQGLSPRGDELVVDAYAGVGTFALLLAPLVKRVIAIEESKAAVADAQASASGVDNVEFWEKKTEEGLGELREQPDAVILDPPRTGCHPRALEALLQVAAEKVIYVSCDPASLARDLRVLCQGGYQLREIQPVDMFPQTHHIECVATLVRR